MPIIEITSLEHPGVEVYARLTDRRLRLATDDAPNGIFIAESPKVITTAIETGYTPLSMLAERRHIDGDAAPIVVQFPNIPVYTGERELLASLTGYVLTRGVLCAMQRPALPTVEAICRDARRVVVIDSVSDSTNIGSIFRSAAALGFDAVLLTTRAACAVDVALGSGGFAALAGAQNGGVGPCRPLHHPRQPRAERRGAHCTDSRRGRLRP